MNPRRQRRMWILICILAGVSLSVALVLIAMRQSIDLFYTPSEVIQGKGPQLQKPVVGQSLRIGGLVVPGTVLRDDSGTALNVEFKLIDTGPMVRVRYEGILPDLFREGQGIVARGTLISPDLIDASEVLAKHDENYMPPEIKAVIDKAHGTNTTTTPSGSGEAL